jgi:hypothetical protein
LGSLTITTEGLGALTIGEPVPTGADTSVAGDTALVRWDATHCLSDDLGTSPGGPYAGAWLPSYPLAQSPALGERPPFYLMTADGFRSGPIREINLWTSDVATAAGIRPGDSRAAVLAAYPHIDEVTHNLLSDVYALNGVKGRLLIEVANESDIPELHGYWGSAVDTVLWTRVVPREVAASPIAASDAGGPCVL